MGLPCPPFTACSFEILKAHPDGAMTSEGAFAENAYIGLTPASTQATVQTMLCSYEAITTPTPPR